MDQTSYVVIGQHLVNIAAVAASHWERETLYVHLIGGRFVTFKGQEAQAVWNVLQRGAEDLATGELKE